MRLYRVSKVIASRMKRDADAVYTAITETEPVELGEHWPALHYTLCSESPMPRHAALAQGVAWDDKSFENVLMGGDATPYADGLTVARVLAPKAVKALAAKLRKLTPETVKGRVDDRIDDFLPPTWSKAKKRTAVVKLLNLLIECFAAAANAGEGILLYVP
jgi:hypothetical protein